MEPISRLARCEVGGQDGKHGRGHPHHRRREREGLCVRGAQVQLPHGLVGAGGTPVDVSEGRLWRSGFAIRLRKC